MVRNREPPDLAAPAWYTGGRKDELDLQVGRDLFEMPGGEVAAVVGVEDLGNATDLPAGITLAPDRIPQGQGGLERAGRFQTETVARDGPTMVVFDERQPRLDGRAVRCAQMDWEQGVIGLPDFIGALGVAPVKQVIGFGIGARPVMGERDQGGVETTNNGTHLPLARHRPALLLCERSDETLDRR